MVVPEGLEKAVVCLPSATARPSSSRWDIHRIGADKGAAGPEEASWVLPAAMQLRSGGARACASALTLCGLTPEAPRLTPPACTTDGHHSPETFLAASSALPLLCLPPEE